MRTLLAAIGFALAAGSAQAQELRDFCAERPGKATPPCVVDKGHAMVETGLVDAVFVRGQDHSDLYALGATAFRWGVSPRFEIGLDWIPLVVDRERGQESRTGVGDAALDVKAILTDPEAKGLAVAAQAFVIAPTATKGLGAGGWVGGLRLPVGTPLSPDTDFALTPELDLVRDADGHGSHLAWAAAAGVSHGFGATTLGVEVWGMVDDDPAERTYQASLDLSAARMFGDSAQFDGGVNFGLNRTTPDVEVYVGIAKRF
jgi:hypothetical protein